MSEKMQVLDELIERLKTNLPKDADMELVTKIISEYMFVRREATDGLRDALFETIKNHLKETPMTTIEIGAAIDEVLFQVGLQGHLAVAMKDKNFMAMLQGTKNATPQPIATDTYVAGYG